MTLPRSVRATSLIEVMVASSIFLIVLTSTTMAVSFGCRQAGHARRVHEADSIAAAQMEQLVRIAADGLPGPGSNRFDSSGRVDDEGLYRVSWTVENNRPIPDGARLQVVVRWTEDSERSIKLQTYLATAPVPRSRRDR